MIKQPSGNTSVRNAAYRRPTQGYAPSRALTDVTFNQESYSCILDSSNGSLREITVGGSCQVYRIFSAFRDSAWGTPQPVIDLVEESENMVVLRGDYASAGYGLITTTTVTMEASSLRVEYRAEATQAITRTRLGLCVLLPAALAGSWITATDINGNSNIIQLPVLIEPHKLCTDVARIGYETSRNKVQIDFEGDVFEMEDQRNWTDFSYKLYSTPLTIPYPVHLPAGTIVEQAVSIKMFPGSSPTTESRERMGTPITLLNRKNKVLFTKSVPVLPQIGTRVGPDINGPVALPVDFVRIDLLSQLTSAQVASALTVAGNLAVHLYEWNQALLSRRIRKLFERHQIARHTVGNLVSGQLTAPAASHSLGPALVGTDGTFAQLNRARPTMPAGAAVAIAVSPQFHDFDDRTILDNLFGLRAVFNSIAVLYPGIPVEISLMELTPHFNPAAGGREQNARTRIADPRLQTEFALTWAFAAFCEASAAGVEAVCLFDSSGLHGLFQNGAPLPAARMVVDLRQLQEDGGPYAVSLPAFEDRETCYSLKGKGGVIMANPRGVIP